MGKGRFFFTWLLLIALSLSGAPVYAQGVSGNQDREKPLFIRAEWTFDGIGDEAKQGLCIVIKGDTIDAIGSDLPVPKNARVLEAEGMCAMPGLIDAHVRLLDGFEITPVYLFPAFGVTTVCDFENSVLRAEGLSDTIATGRILGPNLVYGGESLASKEGATRLQRAVETREEIEDALRLLADHGARFVAFSSKLDKPAAVMAAELAGEADLPWAADLLENREIDAFDAIVMHAHRIDRSGGIPQALRTDPENTRLPEKSVLFSWLDVDAERKAELIRLLKEEHVYLVPTLVAFEAMSGFKDDPLAEERLHPALPEGTREYWSRMLDDFEASPWWPAACRLHFDYSRRFVKEAAEAGVPIVAGSATPTPGVCPGLGLHRELELLVEAGLSPAWALKAATSNAAACLGEADRLGTLEPGKRADLVIVKGNPLKEIGFSRDIQWVILGGKVVKRDEIPGLK